MSSMTDLIVGGGIWLRGRRGGKIGAKTARMSAKANAGRQFFWEKNDVGLKEFLLGDLK